MNLSRALAVSLLATVALPPSLLSAQVAPTEVHEQAVDEFGLDRKTGRFVWSSGSLIGIGPEGAHLNIVVTGLDNPPNAETVYKPGAYSVEVNGPRLTFSHIAKTFPQFSGEVDPDWIDATVDYQGGSHTFTCRTAAPEECTSHYFSGMELYQQASSFLFVDRDGLRITFSTDPSDGLIVIEYPDGRIVEMLPGRYRRTIKVFF